LKSGPGTKAMAIRHYERPTLHLALADVFSEHFSNELEQAYLYVNLLCKHLCLHVLHECQVFESGPGTIDELRARAGVAPQGEYVLSTALDLLAEAGIIGKENGVWALKQECPRDDTARLQVDARHSCPRAAATFDFINNCHDHAAAFLMGREPGITTVFPRGDLQLWERLHCEDRIMSIYADLILPALELLCPKGARVLEIGAGVGGVLRKVFPFLREWGIKEYWFTDLGKLFVQRGAQIYQDDPSLRFQELNLDLPLSDQGVDPASFDLIVGVNVLHLPKNLPFALRELRSALKETGQLVCAEGSPPQPGKRWPLDIAFGFLHGWWDVGIDPVLRPRPGFLFPSEWERVLTACGFEDVSALPGESWFDGDCRGGVIVASRMPSDALGTRGPSA